MLFSQLHDYIPYAHDGAEKSLSCQVYQNVTIRLPGRHSADTVPVGGDFCVCTTTDVWTEHEFTHTDLFDLCEQYYNLDKEFAGRLAEAYLGVITDKYAPAEGVENVLRDSQVELDSLPHLRPLAFLQTVQTLAVAEFRRYHQHESPRFGGRYVPFRFSVGILTGGWKASDAINMQRRGRIGVEIVEKANGRPEITKELMKK